LGHSIDCRWLVSTRYPDERYSMTSGKAVGMVCELLEAVI
jgi:hypothetical protein